MPNAPGPPVVLLGGDTNALAIARSLGAFGVTVHGIGVAPYVERSRYLTPIRPAGSGKPEDVWARFLLGPDAQRHRGSVLIATSDIGITMLCRYQAELAELYTFDKFDASAQLGMLDKLSTYEGARSAGVPTPLFWRVDSESDIETWRNELVYPLIVKPLLSHEYKARFPGVTKFRLVHDHTELLSAYRELAAAGLAVMLVEKIPGSDEQLCSYTTYVDSSGSPTFDYTKSMLRRNPPNEGLGCYHITDWNPEVREVGQRLIEHVGLRGVSVSEFIRDTRDGKLKLIECNARFSAAVPLTVAAGLDLPKHVYLRTIGEHHELPSDYTTGLRMLYLSDDVRSFLALRRRGELSLGGWIRSLAHRQTFPIFRFDDPAPAIARAAQRLGKAATRALPKASPRRQAA
ncbi:carboxylate--amine ligase [Pseudonocardia sp. TRM90224]|uniref:carboxylate--amine ligase n=1 Tax=Pseudonocardia sp. TRM90224 TaxID=2812678 RepID=UPI001E34B916|nr:ATP-grasp domain-containing protein [Pseudonocardia sp. TRM90224]